MYIYVNSVKFYVVKIESYLFDYYLATCNIHTNYFIYSHFI